MELQIAYPSQLLICLLQRTMFITGVVTRVSSQMEWSRFLLKLLLQGRAMVRTKRFTMVNASLRPFPNYDGVPLVSIAILIGLFPYRSPHSCSLFWRHHQTEGRRCRFCPRCFFLDRHLEQDQLRHLLTFLARKAFG